MSKRNGGCGRNGNTERCERVLVNAESGKHVKGGRQTADRRNVLDGQAERSIKNGSRERRWSGSMTFYPRPGTKTVPPEKSPHGRRAHYSERSTCISLDSLRPILYIETRNSQLHVRIATHRFEHKPRISHDPRLLGHRLGISDSMEMEGW